jgi:nickel/cobalt exporter
VRGSVTQAVLLGLAAGASHTLVVWAVAMIGLLYASRFDAAAAEPYFQVMAGAVVVAVAVWMLWRIQGDQHAHHHHGPAVHRIDTSGGQLALELFEEGVPARWRLHVEDGRRCDAALVSLETLRPGGGRQAFTFTDRGGYLESVETIPEPHAFTAQLRLRRNGGQEEHVVAFHDPAPDGAGDHAGQDAHARAHAEEIQRRFAGRPVTTWQIVLFGLTGGLIPCPAAITVLLVCLQVQEVTLGLALVLGFSVGLAAVMVTVGVAAAMGLRQAERRWAGLFDRLAGRAPYASAALVLMVGCYMTLQGWAGLSAAG